MSSNCIKRFTSLRIYTRPLSLGELNHFSWQNIYLDTPLRRGTLGVDLNQLFEPLVLAWLRRMHMEVRQWVDNVSVFLQSVWTIKLIQCVPSRL